MGMLNHQASAQLTLKLEKPSMFLPVDIGEIRVNHSKITPTWIPLEMLLNFWRTSLRNHIARTSSLRYSGIQGKPTVDF